MSEIPNTYDHTSESWSKKRVYEEGNKSRDTLRRSLYLEGRVDELSIELWEEHMNKFGQMPQGGNINAAFLDSLRNNEGLTKFKEDFHGFVYQLTQKYQKEIIDTVSDINNDTLQSEVEARLGKLKNIWKESLNVPQVVEINISKDLKSFTKQLMDDIEKQKGVFQKTKSIIDHFGSGFDKLGNTDAAKNVKKFIEKIKDSSVSDSEIFQDFQNLGKEEKKIFNQYSQEIFQDIINQGSDFMNSISDWSSEKAMEMKKMWKEITSANLSLDDGINSGIFAAGTVAFVYSWMAFASPKGQAIETLKSMINRFSVIGVLAVSAQGAGVPLIENVSKFTGKALVEWPLETMMTVMDRFDGLASGDMDRVLSGSMPALLRDDFYNDEEKQLNFFKHMDPPSTKNIISNMYSSYLRDARDIAKSSYELRQGLIQDTLTLVRGDLPEAEKKLKIAEVREKFQKDLEIINKQREKIREKSENNNNNIHYISPEKRKILARFVGNNQGTIYSEEEFQALHKRYLSGDVVGHKKLARYFLTRAVRRTQQIMGTLMDSDEWGGLVRSNKTISENILDIDAFRDKQLRSMFNYNEINNYITKADAYKARGGFEKLTSSGLMGFSGVFIGYAYFVSLIGALVGKTIFSKSPHKEVKKNKYEEGLKKYIEKKKWKKTIDQLKKSGVIHPAESVKLKKIPKEDRIVFFEHFNKGGEGDQKKLLSRNTFWEEVKHKNLSNKFIKTKSNIFGIASKTIPAKRKSAIAQKIVELQKSRDKKDIKNYIIDSSIITKIDLEERLRDAVTKDAKKVILDGFLTEIKSQIDIL